VQSASRNEAIISGRIPVSAGIGLRAQHHADLVRSTPQVSWLEAHSENYFHLDSPATRVLLTLRERYALSLHGVGLSLGSSDPLDKTHLKKLKQLIERAEPALVSEHLSWGSVENRFVNDLLPLPYTSESLTHMIDRVDQTQHALGRSIAIENISSYLQFSHSDIAEPQFLSELSQATGCGLLVDINNLYVNECNHGLDARHFIDAIPAQAVQELHLAGHSVNRLGDVELVIDTHSAPVSDAVWALYEFTLRRFGARPTLIEWDSEIPSLDVLIREADKATDRLEKLHELAA
jgi:uncharacterized protein (UPF0276 family)